MKTSPFVLQTVLLVFTGVATCSLNCDGPIETSQGFMVGEEMISTKGRKFCAYRGIPYAKPPIDELRFRPPEPLERLTEIFNATRDAPMCPQFNYWFDDISYSEDCLALNIYTPRGYRIYGGQGRPRSKLPVLVYIHEGAFTAGEAGLRSKPPQRLMNKPVVLVMIQYRLGIFGFLSTGDSEASGNFGMLDQVFALQWVQKNIAAFGGDGRRVTIFGQSAGGASVTYHLLSPMSKGLFRSAIAQSGSVLNYWALQKNPVRWAVNLGQELRCNASNNTRALVKCLRLKPAKEILDTIIRLNWHDNNVAPFVPVIENPAHGRFLTENPLKLFKEGRINKVPVMTGTTRDEAALVFYGNETKYDKIDEAFFNNTLPAVLNLLTKYETNLTNLSYAVKTEYFDKIDVNNRSQVVRAVVDMFTDAAFLAGTGTTVKLMSDLHVPVYMYLFAHAGNVSETNFTGQRDVKHEDDLYYLFNRTVLTEEDEKFSDELVNMWFNFAIEGNPTPSGFQGTKWTTAGSGEKLKYLEMGEEANTMKVQTDMMIERIQFWNKNAPFTDDPNT